MLKISLEQYDRLNVAYAEQRRTRLLARLRAEGAVDEATGDAEARRLLDEAITEGARLEIVEDEDVMTLAHAVFARREGRLDALRAEQVGTILANVSIPASERMEFMKHHVLRPQGQ